MDTSSVQFVIRSQYALYMDDRKQSFKMLKHLYRRKFSHNSLNQRVIICSLMNSDQSSEEMRRRLFFFKVTFTSGERI